MFALFVTSTIISQKTIVTENFGGSYAHNESMSTNSSGWTHTGAGDFVHKIVSGSGASGSNCFAQLGTSGAASASQDIQLYAGNTYEFKAYVKTVNSRIYVTLRINSGGIDVATSGNTSANGSWEELSCSYTPAADEMTSFQFVKTQGQLANIDNIKVICTSCPDKNYVFDFNDSKEGWISGGGCNVSLGNDAMNINATGNNVLVRSGNLNADLGLITTDFDRARVTFRTPYAASGAGAGKLYFYSLSGGNSQFAVFDITRDAANTTTFQTFEIDLTAAPTTGNYTGSIARLGFRAPWGIDIGDICHLQKVELFNQPQAPVPALTLTGIMDFGLSGSSGKALMLTANQSISDLSQYGIGSATNGGGTDGQEYTFPAVNVSSGQHIVLCRDSAALSTYFDGCLEQFNGAIHPTLIITGSNEPSGNGNDAYELFYNGVVVETFGDINSSTNTYRDSWAWKDTAAANVGNWVYGGNDCSDNSTTTQTSGCPFPLATTSCLVQATCSDPTGLTASNITSSTADISWVLGGTETLWNVEYGLSGFNLGTGSETDISSQNTLFGTGPNTTWPYVYTAATIGDGNNGSQQTFVINVTSLPTGGANYRVTKTVANGNWFQATAQPLQLGINTITVSGVSFDRSVKIQFSSGAVSFDALTLNGSSVYSPSSYAVPGLTTNSYSLTGLNVNTAYDFYVQADCGNGQTSNWIGPYSFIPNSGTYPIMLTGVMDFGLSGNFGKALMLTANQSISDLSQYGIGSATNGGGTDGQEYTFPAVNVSSGQHIVLCRDSAALSTYFDGCLEQFNGAIHPTLIITGSNEPSGNGNDAYELFYNGVVVETFGDINSSTNTYRDSWAWKDTAAANVGNWVYGGNDCSDNSTTTQTSGCPFPLATTSCLVQATCSDPTGLTASNIMTSSVDVSWVLGGTETVWNVEYGLTGFTLGSGTLTSTTTPSYSMSGLSDNTSYDVYVQADCGSGNVSQWLGPLSVTTSLAPGSCGIFTLELYDSYGDGWNGGSLDVVLNGVSYYSGLTILSGFGPETYQIAVDIGDVVDFNYMSGAYAGENSYKVYDQNNALLFEEGSGSAIPGSVSGVSACPSCPDPTGLTASNVTSTSADLAWTAGGTETAWNVEYGLTGFTLGSGTLTSTTTPSYSMSGLSDNTSYDVYVQADCGSGNVSQWLGPLSITTSIAPGSCGIFTLELYDSWGDGWNGGSLDVVLNGSVFITGATIVTGAGPEVYQIPVNIGDVVDFNYTSGAYAGENSYKVYDQNGVEIIHEGAGSSTPNSVSGVNACPSCSDPAGLTASNVTSTSADLAWISTGTETVWNIEYGATGFAAGSGTIVSVTANPYVLTGLTPQTVYDFYVQADCGSGV